MAWRPGAKPMRPRCARLRTTRIIRASFTRSTVPRYFAQAAAFDSSASVSCATGWGKTELRFRLRPLERYRAAGLRNRSAIAADAADGAATRPATGNAAGRSGDGRWAKMDSPSRSRADTARRRSLRLKAAPAWPSTAKRGAGHSRRTGCEQLRARWESTSIRSSIWIPRLARPGAGPSSSGARRREQPRGG